MSDTRPDLDRIWAGWRAEYVTRATESHRDGTYTCILCALADGGEEHLVLARNELVFAVMNGYPYNSGHLMVAPVRHVGDLADLTVDESNALMAMTRDAVTAVNAAFSPDGVNVGFNLGAAAGAGVPDHVHGHVLPRWIADANFMTTVANTRVLPEAIDASYEKLRAVWPEG